MEVGKPHKTKRVRTVMRPVLLVQLWCQKLTKTTWISIFALQWGILIKKILKADPSRDLKYVFRDKDKCNENGWLLHLNELFDMALKTELTSESVITLKHHTYDRQLDMRRTVLQIQVRIVKLSPLKSFKFQTLMIVTSHPTIYLLFLYWWGSFTKSISKIQIVGSKYVIARDSICNYIINKISKLHQELVYSGRQLCRVYVDQAFKSWLSDKTFFGRKNWTRIFFILLGGFFSTLCWLSLSWLSDKTSFRRKKLNQDFLFCSAVMSSSLCWPSLSWLSEGKHW